MPNVARIAAIVVLVFLLLALLVLVFGALGLIPVAVRGLSAGVKATASKGVVFACIIYFGGLISVTPHALLLRVLRVRSEAAFFAVGILSGWLLLVSAYAIEPWFAAAGHARTVSEGIELFVATIVLRPAYFVPAIWTPAGIVAGLIGTGLIGGLVGWLWSLRAQPVPVETGQEISRTVQRHPASWWPFC